MMKRLAAGGIWSLISIAAIISPAWAQPPEVTTNTFRPQVIEASNAAPVVVNFFAPWCGPCRTYFDVLDPVAADYDGRLRLFSLNVDAAPEIAAAYGVASLPTLVVFRDGKALDKLVGRKPEADVRKLFDGQIAAAAAPEGPVFPRRNSSLPPCIGDACDALEAGANLLSNCRIRNGGGRPIRVRVHDGDGGVLPLSKIAPGSEATLASPRGCIPAKAISGFEASYTD